MGKIDFKSILIEKNLLCNLQAIDIRLINSRGEAIVSQGKTYSLKTEMFITLL
jgi:hypothetical protein